MLRQLSECYILSLQEFDFLSLLLDFLFKKVDAFSHQFHDFISLGIRCFLKESQPRGLLPPPQQNSGTHPDDCGEQPIGYSE